MESIRKIAAKDLGDVGAVVTFDTLRFKVTGPHGVLDPQPHYGLADRMARHPNFKWLGFDDGGAVVRQGVAADKIPSVAEVRRKLGGQVDVRGEPQTPNGELARVVRDERAKPATPPAKPTINALGIPSPTALRDTFERAEARLAADDGRRVKAERPSPVSTKQQIDELELDDVELDPKMERLDVVPAYEDDDDATPNAKLSRSRAKDAADLQTFAAAFEEIEKVQVEPDGFEASLFGGEATQSESDDDDGDDERAGAVLANMGKSELRRMAKKLRVQGYKQMTPPLLVKAIAAQAAKDGVKIADIAVSGVDDDE